MALTRNGRVVVRVRDQGNPIYDNLYKSKKPSDTKPSNPKDAAATTRLDLSVFPESAVIYGALAFTEGAYKYGAYNYREVGVSASVYVAACKRHLAKWYNGKNKDKKTKIPHLANALACIAVMIDGEVKGNLIDDRPPAVDLEELFETAQELVAHLQKLFPNAVPRYTEKGATKDVELSSAKTRSEVQRPSKNTRKVGRSVKPRSPRMV